MKEPIKPDEEDCCNSGCNPCIFDIYEKQLQLYKNYLQGCGTPIQHEDNAISQLEYRQFLVVDNKSICKEHKLIAFKSKSLEHRQVWWKAGSYFLVKYILEDLQMTRAYTPLKISCDSDKDYDFTVVVKQYENGIVSNYMCNLNIDEETLWRGPYGSYETKPNDYDRIIMIAQGTGIAPFFSIIEQVLNNQHDMTKLILFYCCQCFNTVLFRNNLYSFKSYWNFTYNIYVASSLLECALKYQEPIKHKKLSLDDFDEIKPISVRDQFLICGSKEFMNDFKSILSVDVPLENIVLF